MFNASGRKTSVQARACGFALALGFVVAAPLAQAGVITETINFNHIAAGTLIGSSVSVGNGFSFNYGGVGFGDAQQAYDVGGGNIVMVDSNPANASGAQAILSRTGGGAFTVLSIDIANLDNSSSFVAGSGGAGGYGTRIGIDPGNLGYAPTSSTFSTIDLSGNLALQNIVGFSTDIVSAPNANFAIDNIVVKYVPEPATLALLGLGLAGLGFSRRRKS